MSRARNPRQYPIVTAGAPTAGAAKEFTRVPITWSGDIVGWRVEVYAGTGTTWTTITNQNFLWYETETSTVGYTITDRAGTAVFDRAEFANEPTADTTAGELILTKTSGGGAVIPALPDGYLSYSITLDAGVLGTGTNVSVWILCKD